MPCHTFYEILVYSFIKNKRCTFCVKFAWNGWKSYLLSAREIVNLFHLCFAKYEKFSSHVHFIRARKTSPKCLELAQMRVCISVAV